MCQKGRNMLQRKAVLTTLPLDGTGSSDGLPIGEITIGYLFSCQLFGAAFDILIFGYPSIAGSDMLLWVTASDTLKWGSFRFIQLFTLWPLQLTQPLWVKRWYHIQRLVMHMLAMKVPHHSNSPRGWWFLGLMNRTVLLSKGIVNNSLIIQFTNIIISFSITNINLC